MTTANAIEFTLGRALSAVTGNGALTATTIARVYATPSAGRLSAIALGPVFVRGNL
jgi:hypothetical protein